VCSDHACCAHEQKVDAKNPGNIFAAKSGFGGTEYLLSGLFTEGKRRGMTLGHMAELVCKNPAERYGLATKGDIRVGLDADVVLFDPNKSFVVRASESPSEQGYTPFEGMELQGAVRSTFVRGNLVFDNGAPVGAPQGKYVRRVPGVTSAE
jgi:allantoinase